MNHILRALQRGRGETGPQISAASMRSKGSMAEPWRQSPGADYIEGVLDGRIPACKSIVKAVERAVLDHEAGPDRGLVYHPQKAWKVIRYGELFCVHTKGRWANQPFKHQGWQKFITGELFGWCNADSGLRRYRTALIEVPKRQGKTVYLAVIGLYGFHGDGENGAEVYSMASEEKQAKIVFNQARMMVIRSSVLREDIIPYSASLSIPSNDARMMPLPSDPDTIDGNNPHFQIVDELHRHKTRDVWDLCQNATGSREQPLTAAITTAGQDLASVCYEQHEYGLNILDGIFENDRYFAFIATPDEGYDWRDEKEWYKLNPSLGVNIKIEDMRDLAKEAEQKPLANLAFRRLRLNQWTRSVASWVNIEDWKACYADIDPESLFGLPCYMGIDLAVQKDMSAIALLFDLDPYWVVRMRYYCPEKAIHERTINENLPYEQWVEQGHLIKTPGNIIDFERIFGDIVGTDEAPGLMEQYNILDAGMDPYRASVLGTQLMNYGLKVTWVRQGTLSLNEPMEQVEGKIASHNLVHFNHPILSWNARNVVVRKDVNGMMAPNREKSKEKIDGFSALLDAANRLIGDMELNSGQSSMDQMPLIVNVG